MQDVPIPSTDPVEPALGSNSVAALPLPVRVYLAAVILLLIALLARLPSLIDDYSCLEHGRKAYHHGRFAATVEYSREFIRRYPESADAWARMGIALYGSGQMQEAEAAMHRALALDPNRFDAPELNRYLQNIARTRQ